MEESRNSLDLCDLVRFARRTFSKRMKLRADDQAAQPQN